MTFLELLSRKFCTAPKSFKMHDLMFIGLVSARSYEIGVVGYNWLVGWLVGLLVGNAVFSEKYFSDILHEVRGL